LVSYQKAHACMALLTSCTVLTLQSMQQDK
jgi:hypothetical protein